MNLIKHHLLANHKKTHIRRNIFVFAAQQWSHFWSICKLRYAVQYIRTQLCSSGGIVKLCLNIFGSGGQISNCSWTILNFHQGSTPIIR